MAESHHKPRNTPERDRAWGRWLGKRNAARVLAEAARAPSMDERIQRWRYLYCRIPIEHQVSDER